MDNSPKKSTSLNLDFSDILLGLSYLPALNLITSRTMFNDKMKKKMDYPHRQQVNYASNEKLNKFSKTSLKTWIDNYYETKAKLGHYSPSLTRDLEQAIENNMRKIKRMKYSNKIIDMFNSKKMTHHINNIGNLIYSNLKNNMMKGKTSDYVEKEFPAKTPQDMSQINECLLNKFEIITDELKDLSSVKTQISEKTMMPKTWQKCEMIGQNQIENSGFNPSKHNTVELKRSIYSNIKNNIMTSEDRVQNFSGMNINDCNDIAISNTDNYIQQDLVYTKHQTTDSDYPALNKTSELHQPKSVKRIPKKNFDSPIQSPNNYKTFTCNFRSRHLSESSVDSEESSFIVFESQSEEESTDSDYESSSGEESDDNECNKRSTRKVRFTLKPEVHVMRAWNFAYRSARKGPWEQIALDRERFRCRINCASKVLNPILSLQHREQIYLNRFIIRD